MIVRRERERWATPRIARAEENVAAKIRTILDNESPLEEVNINTEGFARDQIEATELFKKSRLFILTGPPGTGKTYMLARLVEAMRGQLIEMCAPTGKAAKQISMSMEKTTGHKARTIHSLLCPQMNEETLEFEFIHGPKNPLPVDFLVIDEMSMVDIRLAESLFMALDNKTRILIVGDQYQLPSVGPGSVLRDMLAANVPNYELSEIKRNQGLIVKACHSIKNGIRPTPCTGRLDLEQGFNWRHVQSESTNEIMEIVKNLYTYAIPALEIADMQTVVLTISPMNERGDLSCEKMNKAIQEILKRDRVAVAGLEFSVGDKIVRLKNGLVTGQTIEKGVDDDPDECENQKVRIVNGDVGIVEAIEGNKIQIRFSNPERVVWLPKSDHNVKLAYCMTCHKMQGSEAKIVIMPMHKEFTYSPIMTNEWVYTAFSRAKIALITVGQFETIRSAMRKTGNDKRKTLLQRMIDRGE